MQSKLVSRSDIAKLQIWSSLSKNRLWHSLIISVREGNKSQNERGKWNAFLVLTMAIYMRQLRLRHQADLISVDMIFKNQGSKYSFYWSHHGNISILSDWGYGIISLHTVQQGIVWKECTLNREKLLCLLWLRKNQWLCLSSSFFLWSSVQIDKIHIATTL